MLGKPSSSFLCPFPNFLSSSHCSFSCAHMCANVQHNLCPRHCHITQVIWRTSKEVGCGLCNGGGRQYPYILVCKYNPSGNVGGQFGNNARPVSKTANDCKGGPFVAARPFHAHAL